MNDTNDDLLQLLCGFLPPEDYAARHQLSLEATCALRDEALQRLSARLPRRPSKKGWLVAASAAVLLALLTPTGALAQLISFTPDTPAVAAQVNGNFQQLRTWLEQKVGTVGTADISTSGSLTTAALSVSGASNLQGPLTTGPLTATTLTATTLTAGSLTVTGTFSGSGTLNGVSLRRKSGNNGTLNCDSYCSNGGFQGFSGSCVGARLPSGQYTADCGFSPGLLPVTQELGCLCATY
ncbi:MAG: hypothetical protein Q8S33_20360 [Myxococcales bacterium]|nr:hypothetical protein [Myxococcales bacterium]MDP3502704.1 hypothetical protein [Myxococcales bacterium]